MIYFIFKLLNIIVYLSIFNIDTKVTNLLNLFLPQCVPELSWGPQRGRYTCECRAGYYLPNGANALPGSIVELDPSGEHR